MLISAATSGLRAQRTVGFNAVVRVAMVVPQEPAPSTVTFISCLPRRATATYGNLWERSRPPLGARTEVVTPPG